MSDFNLGLIFFFCAVMTGVNGLLTTLTLKMYSEIFKEIAQQRRQR